MRAWTYFNMVRIFGDVPYFPEDLATEEEINNYVLSDDNGSFLDLFAIVDTFTSQLESEIGLDRVGVNYLTDGMTDRSYTIRYQVCLY